MFCTPLYHTSCIIILYFILYPNPYYTFPKHLCTFSLEYLGFFSLFSLHIRSRNKAYLTWHRYYVNLIIPLNVKQCIILYKRSLILKFLYKNLNRLCIQIYNKTTIRVKSVSRHQLNLQPLAFGPMPDIGISV